MGRRLNLIMRTIMYYQIVDRIGDRFEDYLTSTNSNRAASNYEATSI